MEMEGTPRQTCLLPLAFGFLGVGVARQVRALLEQVGLDACQDVKAGSQPSLRATKTRLGIGQQPGYPPSEQVLKWVVNSPTPKLHPTGFAHSQVGDGVLIRGVCGASAPQRLGVDRSDCSPGLAGSAAGSALPCAPVAVLFFVVGVCFSHGCCRWAGPPPWLVGFNGKPKQKTNTTLRHFWGAQPLSLFGWVPSTKPANRHLWVTKKRPNPSRFSGLPCF